MARVKYLLGLGLLSLLLAGAAAPAARAAGENYGPGVSAEEIKIGNINPYSGPASAYGTIGRTITAYFRMINDKGGINGRKLTIISYDDGYNPTKTLEMARKLVERDEVLLLFQSLGTPTNSAIRKYMNRKKVPHLFLATGASKWNNPGDFPWTMGFQPNYRTEAGIYAKYIVKNLPGARIGILFQNDDYGKDYLLGFRAGLKRAKERAGRQPAEAPIIVLEQSHEVTDATVESQIVQIKKSGADVFLNISTPKFAAQAIKKAAAIGWRPVHFLNSVSASVKSVLEPAGFENSGGIISSAYMKDPDDPEWADDPELKEWLEFMKKYYPDGSLHNFFNVYGYSVSATLVQVLKQSGDNLTRENVMRQAASLKNFALPMRLPGITVNTSATDFAPIEQMQLQRFSAEKKGWERFGEIIGADGEG